MQFAYRRIARERMDNLTTMAAAMRADKQGLEKEVKRLEKESQ